MRVSVLGAMLLAGSVSGCFLNPDAMPPTETVQTHQLYHSLLRLQPPVVRPEVETITIVHQVKFPFGEAELPDEEMASLAAFLEESGADDQARIEIDGPRRRGGYHDPLAAARIEAIAEGVSRLGLKAEVAARPTQSMAKTEDATVVAVTRAMVIEPDCNVPKTIYSPRPTHIWSCSNAAALGRMVADPLDLERGRALDPADGEYSVLGVQRYRTDKIKLPDAEATSSSSAN